MAPVAAEQPEKKKRVRRGITKALVAISGDKYTFRMRAAGIYIRKYHSRREKLLTWPELLDCATGQFRFPL